MESQKNCLKGAIIGRTAEMVKKLEDEIKDIGFVVSDGKTENEMENLKAYISDSKHFFENGDLVRSFEAIVFAWGIWETLLNLGLVKKE